MLTIVYLLVEKYYQNHVPTVSTKIHATHKADKFFDIFR